MIDVITMGEALYRLTPPNFQTINQASSFEYFLGGSEANTAVGLARLGLKTLWLSRLTDNALGRRMAEALQGHGVDTSRIIWTDEDRIGLYFMEEGAPPRDSQVIYDRANSSMSKINAHHIPVDLFQPNYARLFHTTGITLALSGSALGATQRAWDLARSRGYQLSFDLNYRQKLWTAEACKTASQPFLETANIIFIAYRDAQTVLGIQGTPDETLKALHNRYPQALIAMTRGAEGAGTINPDGAIEHQPAFTAQPIGRIGGGDAFSTGFLYGYLTDADPLQWAVATAAIKYTISGDMPLITRPMVERLLNQQAGTGVVR
jgi:2-dehydro-3-deoxygluconokinase